MMKKTDITMKEALQSKILVAMPEDMLPSMKPSGFPEPRTEKARFFRLDSGYELARAPTAGVAMAAVASPRKPQSTFMPIALGANAVMRLKRLSDPIPAIS